MEVADITNVETAAKFLDEKLPGWEKKITRPIVLSKTLQCILGQNGGYGTLSDKFFKSGDPRECTEDGCSYSLFSNDRYNYDWQREVDKRLAKKPDNTGDFDWAMWQLETGNDVSNNGERFLVGKHYAFTLKQIRSTEWTLAPAQFWSLKPGERFKFTDSDTIFTKCVGDYFINGSTYLVQQSIGESVVIRV